MEVIDANELEAGKSETRGSTKALDHPEWKYVRGHYRGRQDMGFQGYTGLQRQIRHGCKEDRIWGCRDRQEMGAARPDMMGCCKDRQCVGVLPVVHTRLFLALLAPLSRLNHLKIMIQRPQHVS